jgi:hypothetical protein
MMIKHRIVHQWHVFVPAWSDEMINHKAWVARKAWYCSLRFELPWYPMAIGLSWDMWSLDERDCV